MTTDTMSTTAAPAATTTAADLTRLLFDGTFEGVHADIRAALLDPIFDAQEGLSLPEAGRLAYRRSRYLHGRLERPLEILRDPRRLFALAEWPSLLDVSTFSLLMVHYNLCLGTVFDHGLGRADIADHIEALDGLSAFGPYMATELGYGNNVAALRTEAAYDPGTETFVLTTPDALAQKYMSYSGFTDIPKIAVVMARLKSGGRDHGVFPFLVPISDEHGPRPGVRAAACPEKPVQGLDNGVTWFDGVRIPRRNLLAGDMGEFLRDGTFRAAGANHRRRFLRSMSRILPGRLCVSSAAVGAGRASVYIALRYSRQRLTNAPGRNDLPVIEYRSHQLALFTALAKTYAMTFLLNHAKREYLARPGGGADLTDLISITKALSTWEMTEVVAVCRERCGAQGIFSVNRIADYGSLLQGLVTAEGDSQVLLATTAGQLLAREEAEPTPPRPDPAGRQLVDPAFHTALLHYREHTLRAEARALMAEGSGTYLESWNGAMNTALAMARGRGVYLALREFLATVADAATGEARTALHTLACLYGLVELQRDAGWYLARGVLTAEQVSRLPAEIDALCPRLVAHADTLIDGFQLSAELLRAPIAAADYVGAFQALTGIGPDRG